MLLVRARKDAKLCFRAAEDSRRFYAVEKFTPEQVRQDQSDWKTTHIFYGGQRRPVRYKEGGPVYRQRGAKQRPLRLIVIAPTPYRKAKSKKLYYRDPAYLLTTDRSIGVRNHRSSLGPGRCRLGATRGRSPTRGSASGVGPISANLICSDFEEIVSE